MRVSDVWCIDSLKWIFTLDELLLSFMFLQLNGCINQWGGAQGTGLTWNESGFQHHLYFT